MNKLVKTSAAVLMLAFTASPAMAQQAQQQSVLAELTAEISAQVAQVTVDSLASAKANMANTIESWLGELVGSDAATASVVAPVAAEEVIENTSE